MNVADDKPYPQAPDIPDNTDAPPFVNVWDRGSGAYRNYRIPSLLVTKSGALLAFCEGRSGGDTSDVDILVKRSDDGGVSWSEGTVVWGDPGNVSGNPCPVLDEETGTIWMPMTWNHVDDPQPLVMAGTAKYSRLPYMTCSTDDGRTWAPAKNIAEETKHPDWRWYGTGPGVGIQLKRGPHKGRLVTPCNHSAVYPYNQEGYGCHIMYSDDHGTTWKYGAAIEGIAESQVAELIDGRILLHGRNQGPAGLHQKGFAYGLEGGLVWSPLRFDPNLTEPQCQSSLMRYSWPEEGGRSRLVFANPAGTVRGGSGTYFEREKFVVRLSYDEGTTWPVTKLLDHRPSGYSCLAALPGGDIGCLYEAGEESSVDRDGCGLAFTRFSLEWLTDRKDGAR